MLLLPVALLLPSSGAAQSAPGAPPGYSFCANENATCSNLNGATGAVKVAYGAVGMGNRFVFVNVTPTSGSITCNNSVLGEDPDPGVSKSCYVPTDPPGYIFCSNEFAQCAFSGTNTVAFGANGHFVFENKTNGVTCESSQFNNQDPAPGVDACFIPVAPPGYTVCASEHQTCNISASSLYPASVAFGANGDFYFRGFTSNASITCNTQNFFNLDPAPGIVKSCLIGYSLAQPYGYSFCAVENVQCSFDEVNSKAPLTIFYGANGNFISKTITTGSFITCNTKTFYNVDPDYGIAKSCYIPTDPAGYVACATEGGTCNFSGAAFVAYGAVDPATHNATLITENFAGGGFTCGNQVFLSQDPLVGTTKSCYIPAGPVAPGGYGNALCFEENGTCFENWALFWTAYYGFDGAFEYATYTPGSEGRGSPDSFVCDNTTFGQDPAPNTVKSCFVTWTVGQ